MMRLGATLGLCLLSGCGLDTFGIDAGEAGTTDATTGDADPELIAVPFNRGVDVLIVMDNSGSMGEEQARFVAGFSAFLEVLEAGVSGANYRIGITTTDAGNPRCPNTTPENGNMVLSSCLDRIDEGEFIASDLDYSPVCTQNCELRDDDLQILPTTTEVDDGEAPRKWIEKINGVSNVVGADMVAAFQCYGPMGVAGCGFESHLESMYKALANARSSQNKNNYGFIRAAAVLSIVILTDEADCSYNPEFSEIFTSNKAFWFDPTNDVAPSSATCWNAGVACEGSAPTFDVCRAADWNDEFQQADDPGKEAVLFPVEKYVQYVTELEQEKQALDPDQQVLVSLFAGVPVGYEKYEAEIPYVDSPDLSSGGYQSLFGIGPGCFVGPAATPTDTAVPPVREREFAETFNVDPGVGRNLYSICDDDYSDELADIAYQIRDQFKPACMPACVKDTIPETATVEPSCELFETATMSRIAACVAIENGGIPLWALPVDTSVCFGLRTDRTGEQTSAAFDDMSLACADFGANLEFVLVGDTEPIQGISGACALSEDPAKDCPNL
jgi:hypothetical protein